MSFSERVRHPSGALTSKEKNTGWKFFLWIVGIGAVLYIAWRAGWLAKAANAAPAPMSIPNPYGWK